MNATQSIKDPNKPRSNARRVGFSKTRRRIRRTRFQRATVSASVANPEPGSRHGVRGTGGRTGLRPEVSDHEWQVPADPALELSAKPEARRTTYSSARRSSTPCPGNASSTCSTHSAARPPHWFVST